MAYANHLEQRACEGVSRVLAILYLLLYLLLLDKNLVELR
jgi:hypothetical protein